MSTVTPRRTPRTRKGSARKAKPKDLFSKTKQETVEPAVSSATAKRREKASSVSLQKADTTLVGLRNLKSDELTNSHLKRMYALVRRRTGKLGGGGAGGAIYGEVTQKSFARIVDFLKSNCQFGTSSTFIDIGAGLGKPNLHVALDPGVKASVGVELGGERWWQSMDILWHGFEENEAAATGLDSLNGPIFLAHADFLNMKSLEAFTHVYMFDKGFPPILMEHISTVFNSSTKSEYLICYKKPRHIIEEYSFHVEEIGRIVTKMSGSGEGNTCFVYRKIIASSEEERRIKQAKNERKDSKDGSNLPFDWSIPLPPDDPSVAPPVCHAKNYGQEGLNVAMSGSLAAYREWLSDQVGASRAKRRLRSRRNQKKK